MTPPARLELTIRAIALGLLLSVVMGAANVYVGLKAGMTVSASIPAAVMAMLFFKLFSKKSSILEANQVQTCASAGESLAAGIIFTMPALVLIGYWKEFDYWSVTIIAMTGGLLGILFMIPMRRVFVVDNPDLPYPEGIACAAVLKAGESGQENAGAGMSLILGGLLGAVFKLAGGLFGLITGSLEAATAIGSRIFFVGADLSPMLVAVGYIVRLNVALLIFIGGGMSWLIGIPLLGSAELFDNPIDGAYTLWKEQVRYVGVGAMVVGGFSSLVSVRHGLKSAIGEMWHGVSGKRNAVQDDQRDIPASIILLVGTACVVMLAIVNYRFTHDVGVTLLATSIMLVMGFFFTAVASYIVGLVGNSNSPVSGMTITAVLVAGGLLWLFNYSGMTGMVATLGIAAIVCCVACTSGDVCNDLKTGSLVGAAPFRQQIMQIGGVIAAAFVMAPILTLLHHNTPGGIGGENLAAPQASLFQSLAEGFFGQGKLPWGMVGIGAGLGIAILVVDAILKANHSAFRAHLMPIAVGMYLPFGLAIPILIGGILAYWYTRKTPESQHHDVLHRGVLFSSGVIAGEALTAVGIAGLAALVGWLTEKHSEWLIENFGTRVFESLSIPTQLGLSSNLVSSLSVVAAIAMVVSFALLTRPRK
ncbi:MAG: oligopeptide transporter, OPT family [Pirellulaceae bacterium]|jgi:putative OPT family oligopeptide transporter|nr:oligopeptide transporter, OPT family [Pirellulaceae bacterium]